MRPSFVRLASVAVFVLSAFAACSDDKSTSSSPATNGETPDGGSGGDGSVSWNGSRDSGHPTSSNDSGDPPPPGEEPVTTFVTVTKETMSHGGKARTYYLALPNDYDASKSYPLVLSFHGNPGSAQNMMAALPFDRASQSAAVIAYPQADTSDWDLYTPTDNNADMHFIAALPDEIRTKANIDKSRVLGYGYSGGAFFLTQFSCRFGGIFKAISINAGGGPDEEQMGYGQYPNGCYQCPGGPVAAIVTHGATDGEVSPESGAFTHACYATFNGCSTSLSPTTPAPCQQHDGCPTDKPVKWCLIPGQGHGAWAESMKEAWSFFNALP